MSRRNRGRNDDIIIAIGITIAILAVIGFIIKNFFAILFCALAFGSIIIAVILINKYIKSSKTEIKPNKVYPIESQTEPQLETESPLEEVYEEVNEYAGQYMAKDLLTDHELSFYKALKPIADKLGFSTITKVRMADLVKPTANYYRERSEYMSYFGKIKSKHVDFVLCDPETLKVKLLIELDDSSHNTKHSLKRDDFIEKVYQDTGYKLLRTYSDWNLETRIRDALGNPEKVELEALEKANEEVK